MLQILFTGTGSTLSKFQAALRNYAVVTLSGKADIHVCEVRNVYDLRHVPAKSPIPLFIIISNQDKKLIEQLKAFRISGVFLSPLDEDLIKRKLNLVSDSASAASAAGASERDFESLKVKILAKAESIGALTISAQRILHLTNSDVSAVKEISEQIRMDQGISSKVIRMANSPFFGMRQDINSIDRAVVLLGFNTVKNIALAASTSAFYNKQFSMYKTSGNALWEHAYTTALLCEELATDLQEDNGALFLAGLLHDIGKTIMVDFLVSEVSMCEEERKQLGLDHAEVAGMVLNRWQLPNDIIQMVRMHHTSCDELQPRIVYVANRLANCKNSNNAAFESALNSAFSKLPVKNKAGVTHKTASILSVDKVEQ